jgi:hypothetical protein
LDTFIIEDIDIFIRHCQKFLSLLLDMEQYGSTNQLQIFDACYRFKTSAGKAQLKCVTYPTLIQEIILFDLDNIILPYQVLHITPKWIYKLDKNTPFALFSEKFTLGQLQHISF